MRHVLLLAVLTSLAMSAQAVDVYGVAPINKLTREQAPSSGWRAGSMDLECARNEGESVQVVLRSDQPVTGLAVNVGEFRGPEGAVLGAESLRSYRVEWVDINAPFDLNESSENPDFQPDPLPPVDLSTARFDLTSGQNLILWLTVSVPEDARPGIYRAGLEVLDGADRVGELALNLRVRDFALPKRPILQSMVGMATANIYKAHGCKTKEDQERIIRLYFDEYARARLSPFLYAPATQAFSPLPDAAIKWTFVTGEDGKPTGEVELDFTGFDREGELYLNQREAFSAFNFAPYFWARREKDGKKEMYLRAGDGKVGIERRNPDGSVNPVFDQVFINLFRGIAQHLDEKGWLDRAIYYVTDEPGEDDTPAIKEICELVRQADPRIRTSLTYDPANRPRLAELVEEGKSLVSVWIPYCSMYREEVAADQRSKGAEYWLYDVSSAALIGHSGQTNRAIMWDVWRRDAHGYLYYLSTWWGRQASPWERPNFLLAEFTYRYRQGDGFFFYPPLRKGEPEEPILDYVVPTIRWELLREGAEDFDTLRILEARLAANPGANPEAVAKAKQALEDARALADTIGTSAESHGIRDLKFPETEGWSFGLEEGWLHHQGGKRSDLPVELKTGLPDGEYLLTLNVYQDGAYRGKPYSRFLVDGRPYATGKESVKTGVQVSCGMVQVRDGRANFTLSSMDEESGVILYRVALRPFVHAPGTGIYAVRTALAEAIESLPEPGE